MRTRVTFPAQSVRALVGVAAALFLAGCSQVKYAKIKVSSFDGNNLIESSVGKHVVVATYQMEDVEITTSNDGVYLDAWKDSGDSNTFFFSTDSQNGRTVEWYTLANGSNVPSNVELRVTVREQEGNTIEYRRVVESGTTWKIGSWLL